MISLLFPEKCVYCGEIILSSPIPICKQCSSKMPIIKGIRCKYCSREQTQCFCKLGDFAFTKNVSVLKYDGAAATIIKRLKFGKHPQLADFIGKEIAITVHQSYSDIDFDFVTFVPMNKYKLFKRGFNQAQVIAEKVSKQLNLPILSTLTKKFSVKEQKYKNKKERLKGVRGQFKAISTYDGKTILLIDDVFTTGSTLSECSLMLKRAGALQVYTATFAITYKK